MSFDLTSSSSTPVTNTVLIGKSNDPDNGPNKKILVSSDNYPVFHQLNLDHDNMSLNFDAYYENNTWKSGYYNSQYQIEKANDLLSLKYSGNVSQGSTVTWNTALAINTAGSIALGNGGSFFSKLINGRHTYGSSSSSTGTLQTTISIGQTLPNTNYTALVSAEISGNTSNVFSINVYNKTTTSFGVNIRRIDSDGAAWTETLYLNWIIFGA